jgi:hypothetical protein
VKNVRKSSLREERGDRAYWAKATRLQRIKAVEIINRLDESEYAEQTFPRVHRVTRKARS